MANASQEIIITPLPAGYVDEKAKRGRISIHFSPRLVSDPGQPNLDAFPDWLHWPDVVTQTEVKLVVDNGPTMTLKPADTEFTPSMEWWSRLFDGDTFVRPFAYTKLWGRRIRSYSMASVTQRLASVYGSLMSDLSGTMPSAATMESEMRDLGFINEPNAFKRREKLLGQLFGDDGVLNRTNDLTGGFASNDELEFFLLNRFYKRQRNAANNPYKERPDPNFQPTRLAPPRLDFHQGIASVADFPLLMRILGIVVDYEFDFPRNFPKTGSLTVDIDWHGGFPQSQGHIDRKPLWTEFERSKDYFGPLSKKGSIHQKGYLDLRGASDNPTPEVPGPFLLSQVDTDGGALKVLDYSHSLVSRKKFANYRTPERWPTPSLRTTGISVAKRERDKALSSRLAASDKLDSSFIANQKVKLSTDEIVRGYRIDVLDITEGDNRWKSLCLRKGRYIFESPGGDLAIDLDDEGYVKSASTSGEIDGSDDLYLHERMFSFEGWSLVAPRPGRTLPADPSGAPEVPQNQTADLPLSTHFRPQPGTLPKLRFGHKYRLRARLVDIAGNSVSLDDKNDTFVSEILDYRRFEPVLSPTLMPRAFYGEGESLEHMVIRSDFDRTPTQYAQDPEVIAALVGWQHSYLDYNDRHIAPPKTSQQEAELHGMFDDFIGKGKDPKKGFFLASRESGNFFHEHIVNLDTGLPEAIPQASVSLFTPPGVVPTDLDNLPTGDPLKQGEYIVREEEQLITPYLPDPLAFGVALRNLPGDPDGIHLVEFDGDWPDVTPFRIRIVERPGLMNECEQVYPQQHEPSWDAQNNILTVYLEKGRVAHVQYSSIVIPEKVDTLGLQKWTHLSNSDREELRMKIATGGHWMTTPWRTITLVHATQRPLCLPRWLKLSQSRPGIGVTFANLRGDARMNVPTTGQIDLLCSWKEPIDDLSLPGPTELNNQGHVVQLTIDPSRNNDHPLPHPPQGKRKPDPITHEFGDTKHRVIDYSLKGTTRFREYLPPAITKDSYKISRTGPAFQLSIPSSAPPITPQVVDVLPAFEWSEAKLEGGGTRRTRKGNTLRVYLKRPWYSSGEGELLGVVFKTGAANQNLPNLTEWGKDPMFAGSAPSAAIQASRFTLRSRQGSGLTLPETGNSQTAYSVAGHPAHFDESRKLWYADIEINCGSSYFPMIRLALARYQPESIAHAHLSSLARTEFCQLVPDRTAVLQPLANGRFSFKLFGVAPTETHLSRLFDRNPRQAVALGEAMQEGDSEVSPFKKPGLNRYEIRVEYLPNGASPDFGWKPLPDFELKKPLRKRIPKPKLPIKRSPFRQIPSKIAGLRTLAAKHTSLTIGQIARKPAIETIDELAASIPVIPLWAADIIIPAAPGNAIRRVVIEEFELHIHEADEPNPPQAKQTAVKRLVYADIIPV